MVCMYMHIHTYIHTTEYYSVIQKNEIMPFAALWIVVGITILNEIGQTEKDKCHIKSFVETKNTIQINLFTQQKQTHRHRKQIYGYQRGK